MKQQQAYQLKETTVLLVKGLVQGVGFRPFVYKIANELSLFGTVCNNNSGVVIQLQGDKNSIEKFKKTLINNAPSASEIEFIEENKTLEAPFHSFIISKSENINDYITLVSPDIAVCDYCLDDMKQQHHRLEYSFTNCTNCGPRFSIAENIPYDRKNTSMNQFEMCPECYEEYNNVTDRRFHAQPVACNNCGPKYTLHINKIIYTDIFQIITSLKEQLEVGNVVAMKGIGGYHLACDPFNFNALKKLRMIKERDGKPFALMFRDISACKKYVNLSEEEVTELTSWRRPLILVKSIHPDIFGYEITNGLKTLGVFLPYLPFHYQLFETIDLNVLVMTSANKTDCPIIIDDDDALLTFLPHNIPVLVHNRKIINRVDDSILQTDSLGIKLIRRARGYTPKPIYLNFNADGIFAAGAELTGGFCIGKGDQALMSQYIGDIKNLETMEFYEQSFETMKRLFKFTPKFAACDMHPDYLSTSFAQQLNLPVIQVQHHHAHIAACMAEYKLEEPVIGVCYDGTGYGTDGKIWGSEIMIADLNDFKRKFHFEYIPIPGGDKAIKEPWRSAYAYLYCTNNGHVPKNLKLFKQLPENEINLVRIALDKQINSPESCSAGRLFDAVAALLNICIHSGYHAEAALKLENNIEEGIESSYFIDLTPVISWKKVIKQISEDLEKGISKTVIAAKFHNTVAEITFNAIRQLSEETGIRKVIITGGSFQNKYLVKKIVDLINNTSLKVFMPRQLPCNDGGIALGQLAIAAKKLNQCV